MPQKTIKIYCECLEGNEGYSDNEIDSLIDQIDELTKGYVYTQFKIVR